MAYWKKIKNTNAVPVLKDELVFDQTPTVNSTNPVTSDGVARAIAGASGEVPVVTENDNGKVLKAIYDAGGPAVEWGEATVDQNYSASSTNAQSGVAVAQAIAAIPSASYTAGDGIDITANEVSVKAGNGLEIGDVTSTGETVSLTTSAYYTDDFYWYAYDVCPLTDSLLDSIASGLTLKLLHGTYVAYYPNATAYACLYSYASETSSGVTLDKRLVLGSAIPLNSGFIFDNSEVTFDGGSVNAGLSNTTMSDLIADMSSNTYHIGILIKSNDNYLAAGLTISSSQRPSGPTTMATYTSTVTIQDALCVSNPLPAPTSGDSGKVLTVTDTQGNYDWQPVPQELPTYATHAGEVLKVNAGGTGVEWGASGANYSAGSGIAISEQGAISAVGGTGITVTAESTTTQSITVHTQDYEYSWMPGTEYHSVTYVSVLDSSLVSDIQNGGIDVTLSHSFYQVCDSNLNSYKNDWLNNPNQFKAYAAIVYLGAYGATTPTTYVGNTRSRLVLGEVSAPWIDNNQGVPAIAATTVVSYDFDDVNTTLSTITLSDVLANPSDYCMTVLFLDERINEFNDGGSLACTMADVTGAGNYTTGTLVVTVPGAINVTNPLPAYDTTLDVGKVLQVQNDGTLAWVTLT